MSKFGQSKDIENLYYEHENHCGCEDSIDKACLVSTINLSDGGIFNTDELINSALINVFSGTVPPSGVEPNLWRLAHDNLNKAVDEGFGIIKYEHPDFRFVQQLKHNNGVFAAFSSYEQQKELADNLLDKNGKLKPFYKFKKDTNHIVSAHKSHRLTEYNTAVKRARSAAQFKQFKKTAHLYPNIEWLPSRSAKPDVIHRGYYGTILPINDPFWMTSFPGNRWNCKCGWEVTDAEPTGYPATIVKPSAGLDESPIKNGKIFSDSHPHVQRVRKAKRKGIEKEAVKLERKLILEWAKPNLKGKNFKIGDISANITTKGIKEVLNQPHKHYSAKNQLLFNLDEVCENAKFTGSRINGKSNSIIKQYHYYKIDLMAEPSWLVVKELKNGEHQIYTIVDALKNKND